MTTLEWKTAASRMRSDLDRADLNERTRRVLTVLIAFTLMKCRTKVILPDRDGLCSLLGIGKQHMAAVWQECQATRIAEFKRVSQGWQVLVFADSAQWAVDWVWTRERLNQFAAFLELVAGQAQGELIAEDKTVAQARAELAVEASSQVGNQTPGAVPKMGTETLGGLGGRTSNSSGTSESFNVHGLKALNKKLLDHEHVSSETVLLGRCRTLFGDDAMETHGGCWRIRARENPDKLSRVLDETKNAASEGRIRTNPGAYANNVWSWFK